MNLDNRKRVPFCKMERVSGTTVGAMFRKVFRALLALVSVLLESLSSTLTTARHRPVDARLFVQMLDGPW